MALNIIWSPKALDNFHDVITYLKENWNERVIRDLFMKLKILYSK